MSPTQIFANDEVERVVSGSWTSVYGETSSFRGLQPVVNKAFNVYNVVDAKQLGHRSLVVKHTFLLLVRGMLGPWFWDSPKVIMAPFL